MELRRQIRKQAQTRRDALSAAEQQHAARAIAQHFQADPRFHQAGKIAVYLAFRSELSLQPLIDALLAQQWQVYVPCVNPQQQGLMSFQPYVAPSLSVVNRYGINEPEYNAAQQIAAHELDIILCPLVAFDSAGNRMGMGGGYYDRLLHALDGQGPDVIGIAHDCQYVKNLPIKPWDQALKRIISPSHDWRWA